MKKRLTALMLAFVFVFTSAIAYAQTSTFVSQTPNEAEARQLYHGMTFEEFMQTDLYEDSLNQLVNFYGFDLEFAQNYLRTISYIENLSAVFGTAEGWSFPDYIGGIYVDDNGMLVIQLTVAAMRTTASLSNAYETLAQHVDIEHAIVREVAFSHVELLQTHEYLLEVMMSSRNQSPQIFNGFGIRHTENRVTVHIWDYNPEGIEYFRQNILDSPMIMFVPMRGIPMDMNDFETSELMLRIMEAEGIENLENPADVTRVWRIMESGQIESYTSEQETLDANYPFLSSSPYQSYYYQSLQYIGIEGTNSRIVSSGEAIFRAAGGGAIGSAGHAGTIAFRARHILTGREGVVIAGHSFPNANIQTSNVWANGILIGAVGATPNMPLLWQNGGNIDAAFVPMQSGVSASNVMPNGQLLNVSWAWPVGNMPVATQGSTTAAIAPHTLGVVGNITDLNYVRYVRLSSITRTGKILTNLHSFPGDSGAPLYAVGLNNSTLGVLSGGVTDGTAVGGLPRGNEVIFTPAHVIMQGFGLQRY
ncbi:MAG: S1 family peptidase [Defluviitaleaceae bacterium]|nr:S1 family peptidase [Defluviitaleaceae bacterium]